MICSDTDDKEKEIITTVAPHNTKEFFYLDYRTTKNIITVPLCCGSVGTEDDRHSPLQGPPVN